LILGLLLAGVLVVSLFQIRDVEVTGIEHYSKEEIAERVITDKYSTNSLYLFLKYKYTDTEPIPFVDKIEVSLLGPGKVRLRVYEKSIVGYVTYMGANLYFDKDGIVVESSSQIKEGVPCISGLEFSYEDSKKALLENVSFQVKKNETFYITGASGSGKSTLLNIMSGLETEYGGEILYDASELRSLDDAWLHQNVIMVGQEVDILPTTLRENILYSGVAASDEEVINLLTSLKIEYLLDMPGGLEWNMKEIPRALSDGEKKRIAIARAILSRPSVLFLDEPTAGLDNINKMAVTEFIEKSMDGILVIVTHDRVFPEGAKVLYC